MPTATWCGRLADDQRLRPRAACWRCCGTAATTTAGGARDGGYRVRMGLRRQGRAVVLPDTIPYGPHHHPEVGCVDRGAAAGPLLYPLRGGGPVRFRFRAPLSQPAPFLYRTDGARPRLARRLPPGAPRMPTGCGDGAHRRPPRARPAPT